MKDKRRFAGVAVTGVWLAFGIYMLVTQERQSQQNAWGDFFSGFFAPLAFLWLVLGYLQQGEELRNSSKALHLQAEELHSSVEQQRELVQVTRMQVQQEMDALREEREERLAALKPMFLATSGGSIGSGAVTIYKLQVRNAGRAASEVRISTEPPEFAGGEGFWLVSHFGQNESKDFEVKVNDARPRPRAFRQSRPCHAA